MITATRYHDFAAGHRVYGHEGKCAHPHGHGYRVHFTVGPVVGLDRVGRVLDFSVINTLLCQWLEENWDHKFLVWQDDPWAGVLYDLDPDGVVLVPFNPTAELMARYLVQHIAPQQLQGTECVLVSCTIEETRKCSATFAL